MTDEQEKAKRQAYSFNFPPDKKEKFAALARSMNRPMAWLLLEAIDRMIESGGTYPTNTAPPQTSIGNDDALKAYVSKADMSQILSEYVQKDNWDDLRADVADLREQLAEVKTDCDLTTEGVQRLIAEAIATTGNPSQKTKTSTATGDVNHEVWKVANRLEREPELKAAVINGLAAVDTGAKLGQYLADNGFFNSKGGTYSESSANRFRLAIEYLNGGQG
jgi:hypothetical protein